MKRKIKIICIIVIVFFSILFLTLYINKIWIFNPFNNVSIVPSHVITKLQEQIELDSCYLMNEDEVKEKYNINSMEGISNYAVLSSFIGLEAEEIAIFNFNSKKIKEDFKDILMKRAKDIINYYEGYVYSQTEIAKDYEIKEYNNTIIFVIHKNKEKIIKCIEKIILENN